MPTAVTLLIPQGSDIREIQYTVILKILEKYYTVFVDGKSTIPDLKRTFHKFNGKFFGVDMDEWLYFDTDTIEQITPVFAISTDSNIKIAKRDWIDVLKWVRHVLSGADPLPELDEKMFALFPRTATATEAKPIVRVETEKKELPTEYSVAMLAIPEKDLKIFEVIKPFTDRPYTAVIRDYAARGDLPFFTALYVCTTWGVASADHVFLEKIWNHLDMTSKYGPLDLQNRLKDNIEKCTPREGYVPEKEPEVYRMAIPEIVAQWDNKRKAIEEIRK